MNYLPTPYPALSDFYVVVVSSPFVRLFWQESCGQVEEAISTNYVGKSRIVQYFTY